MNPRSRLGAGGFTLIELLVVIAIIAILAGMLLRVDESVPAPMLAGRALHDGRQLGLTDDELVARSIGGDTDSFNQLILRWERPIYALAYRLIGREEDARDVCQEAFLRAFRALPAFRGDAKFSSWLYRITLNLCRDWIRRERRRPVVQAPEDVDLLDLAAGAEPSVPMPTSTPPRRNDAKVGVSTCISPPSTSR